MIMERGLEYWSICDVKSWASEALGAEIAELFEKEEITGECLSEISVEELKEMGVQKMGKRLLVMKKLKSLIHKGQNGSVTGSAGSGACSSPEGSPIEKRPASSPPSQPVVPTPRPPVTTSVTVIRAPIAHIPSHLDSYHCPKRMRLSPPFTPSMLHSTLTPQSNGSLEEALNKLNNYSDMARALSQQTLASSGLLSHDLVGAQHQHTLPGQILKPIPQISSHALPSSSSLSNTSLSHSVASLVSTGSTSPIHNPSSSPSSMCPVSTFTNNNSQGVTDMMVDIKPTLINDLFNDSDISLQSDHPGTGDTVFQVNCRGKLTRESQERLKQTNPRLHSHYLTKRNLIKRACRTVFPDPPPFFYTDADRNSQEDLQILEQLTEKLSSVCCIPELCFSTQGIRNHIIDSCRERRRECKRQSYRPSKARPAGHLYNSDGTQIPESSLESAVMIPSPTKEMTNDIMAQTIALAQNNDRPYTLSQDSADCIIRVLFNVESVYHVRRSVHLIPLTKRLGLSQRVDKNWMIMAIAQGLLNNGFISISETANLEHLMPSDFVLEVPEELLSTLGDEIDVN